jgi:hypothetical protein
LKLAPLATPVIAGVATEPDPDAVTPIVTDALLVLLYVAVIVPGPNGNCEPFTASVAVAVPADPVNAADPKEVPPIENETGPDGVVPFVEVTVAIKYTTSFAATVVKLLSSVTLEPGVVVLPPFHPITSL